jgi:uncharacterized protein HemY
LIARPFASRGVRTHNKFRVLGLVGVLSLDLRVVVFASVLIVVIGILVLVLFVVLIIEAVATLPTSAGAWKARRIINATSDTMCRAGRLGYRSMWLCYVL